MIKIIYCEKCGFAIEIPEVIAIANLNDYIIAVANLNDHATTIINHRKHCIDGVLDESELVDDDIDYMHESHKQASLPGLGAHE